MVLLGLWSILDICRIWRKVLFSSGTLDSHNYKYFVEGRVLKVSEARLMMIKEKLHNDLYFLKGSKLVALTIVSFCLNLDFDITHL